LVIPNGKSLKNGLESLDDIDGSWPVGSTGTQPRGRLGLASVRMPKPHRPHRNAKLPYSGKGLGGSSTVNYYGWTRPPAADVDGEAQRRSDGLGVY
jgi:GMC oxidoreductase